MEIQLSWFDTPTILRMLAMLDVHTLMVDLLLEPIPQISCSDETRTKAETSHESCHKDSNPRHSVPVKLSKDLGGMTLDSKSVHQSHSSKEGVISSRQDTSENDGIDDASSSFGARHFKDDGERRSAGLLGVKVRIVVRDVETDEKN